MLILASSASDRTNGLDPTSNAVDARTRGRVRQAISEDGPLSASAVAYRLGLTPAAVRRHLNALVENCVIKEKEPASTVNRGRGRPARAYIPFNTGPELSPSDAQGSPARGHLAPTGAQVDILPDRLTWRRR